jgi:aminoglycoside phosphotransferase (APT) family kinase protein
LPYLAPRLPLPIPHPLVVGAPAFGYPWHWSIYQWIDGENATLESIADLHRFANDLARFLTALYAIDPSDGPPPGPHNFYRGAPLSVYDSETRHALNVLKDIVDVDAATTIWDSSLSTSWQNSPVWLHGDVSPSNLLVRDGLLSAVIDFGSSGVGDPACDLSIAWTLFAGESRKAFRSALSLDNDTWKRGRGWAVWKALITAASTLDITSAQAKHSLAIINEAVNEA